MTTKEPINPEQVLELLADWLDMDSVYDPEAAEAFVFHHIYALNPATLRAQAEQLREQGWLSVAERLPEELFPVLILAKRQPYVGAWYGPGMGWNVGHAVYRPEDVTHWQPLPAPPAQEASDGE